MDGDETLENSYRQMLVELAAIILPDELETLKFLTKAIIPTRVRESINNVVQFFEALEERDKLSPQNLAHLRTWLQGACKGRVDVFKLIDSYEKRRNLPYTDAIQAEEIRGSSFVKEFELLEDKLGREAFSFLRRLGVEDHILERLKHEHPSNTKEVIHQALKHWEKAEQNAKRDHLVNALKKEYRNDLANKLLTL